jgi:hypothetical protein
MSFELWILREKDVAVFSRMLDFPAIRFLAQRLTEMQDT